MSISYSGVVGHNKVTLPAVEGWGTNLNILREPAKAVHTRKIDKVGDTSAITQTLADSSDRWCESINYYARGIDPMKAVTYNNTGAKQAFYPYRVARDGAFRPPIRRQEDLLPLSRQPRIWTKVDPRRYRPKYTERILNCKTADQTKEVKTRILHPECYSQKTAHNLEPDTKVPAYVSLSTNQVMKLNVNSSKSTQQQTKTENMLRMARQQPLRDALHPTAVAGKSTAHGPSQGEHLTRDVRLRVGQVKYHDFQTNKGFVKETPLGDQIEHGVNLSLKNPIASASVNKTFVKEIPLGDQIEHGVSLSLKNPIASASVNKTFVKETPLGDQIEHGVQLTLNRPYGVGYSNMSRPGAYQRLDQYMKLKDRIAPGEYVGTPGMPMVTFENPIKHLQKVR